MSGNNKEFMKYLTDFSIIGLNMVSSIFIGLGIGYYLDHKVFDTTPVLTLIFLGLGIVAGFRSLWRMSQRKDF